MTYTRRNKDGEILPSLKMAILDTLKKNDIPMTDRQICLNINSKSVGQINAVAHMLQSQGYLKKTKCKYCDCGMVWSLTKKKYNPQ